VRLRLSVVLRQRKKNSAETLTSEELADSLACEIKRHRRDAILQA
jgi:hypothetical protein